MRAIPKHEIEHRKKNGLCLLCASRQHYALQCHLLPNGFVRTYARRAKAQIDKGNMKPISPRRPSPKRSSSQDRVKWDSKTTGGTYPGRYAYPTPTTRVRSLEEEIDPYLQDRKGDEDEGDMEAFLHDLLDYDPDRVLESSFEGLDQPLL